MELNNPTPLMSKLFRFYSKCFAFPYDEMVHELHFLYRRLEQDALDDDDYVYLQQILEIINNFQGIELKEIREEYVMLFTNAQENEAQCPLSATDFLVRHAKHIEIDSLPDMYYDAGLPFDMDEDVDSIILLLEYFSIMLDMYMDDPGMEEEVINFYEIYLISWMPQFCDTLNHASTFSFYKEISNGLKEVLFDISQ